MTDKRIQHPPLPSADRRAGLDLDDRYTREEFEALKKGFEPKEMEDCSLLPPEQVTARSRSALHGGRA